MIGNKSKIKKAISNIQKFLIDFKNQPSDLQKDLKKSLLNILNEREFVVEIKPTKPIILFRFKGDDITLTKVEFVNLPFLEKDKRFLNSSHLTSWTFFKSIPKDEFWISLVDFENSKGNLYQTLAKIVVGEDSSNSDKDKINLFFNAELEKILNHLGVYFNLSYLRTWEPYSKIVADVKPSLFFSSNFLTKANVKEVYSTLKSEESINLYAEELFVTLQYKEQFHSIYNFYDLWEYSNPEFVTVKEEIFDLDKEVVGQIPALVWLNTSPEYLYEKLNQVVENEKNEKRLTKFYDRMRFNFNGIISIFNKKLAIDYHNENPTVVSKDDYQFSKFIANLIRLILKSYSQYSNSENHLVCELNDFSTKILKQFHLGVVLQRFKDGEEMIVPVDGLKYEKISDSFSSSNFVTSLESILITRKVKYTLHLYNIYDSLIYHARNYYEDYLVFEELYHFWKRYPESISVTVSEKEFQALKYFQEGLDNGFIKNDVFVSIPQILEMVETGK